MPAPSTEPRRQGNQSSISKAASENRLVRETFVTSSTALESMRRSKSLLEQEQKSGKMFMYKVIGVLALLTVL